MPQFTCSFTGCPHPIRSNVLCRRHYEQARRGEPLTVLDPALPVDPTCAFDGCPFAAQSKGHCSGHAAQRRRNQKLKPLRTVVPLPKTCTFPGCDRDYRASGLCDGHMRVRRKEGKLRPLKHKTRHGASLAERFEPHCGSDAPTSEGCWIWRKAKNGDGYGALKFTEPETGVSRSMAHQAAWILQNGPIPSGEVLHHTCGRGTTGCCNPDHLQLATEADNTLEMHQRRSYLRRIEALERENGDLRARAEEAERRFVEVERRNVELEAQLASASGEAAWSGAGLVA